MLISGAWRSLVARVLWEFQLIQSKSITIIRLSLNITIPAGQRYGFAVYTTGKFRVLGEDIANGYNHSANTVYSSNDYLDFLTGYSHRSILVQIHAKKRCNKIFDYVVLKHVSHSLIVLKSDSL